MMTCRSCFGHSTMAGFRAATRCRAQEAGHPDVKRKSSRTAPAKGSGGNPLVSRATQETVSSPTSYDSNRILQSRGYSQLADELDHPLAFSSCSALSRQTRSGAYGSSMTRLSGPSGSSFDARSKSTGIPLRRMQTCSVHARHVARAERLLHGSAPTRRSAAPAGPLPPRKAWIVTTDNEAS